ncbi:MAG: rod shape-determining protein MreC [Deltaproteobacteria bacterium GWB2_55_19]|nr:MAG: rod shape-determining protein MreC [Deltaproteobacteria bacterium GWB2_55_19]HAO94004.1 rod shape-determining protein MreC [Deltaproteobacteria bacterium]
MRSQKNVVSFLKKNQIIIASLALALFSLHLALTGRQEVERGFILREILSRTVSPMQRLMLGVQGSVKGVWSGYVNLANVSEENERLRKTLTLVNEDNLRLKEEINLAERLKSILEYKDQLPHKSKAAVIIGFNKEPWARTVTIDKGAKDGIAKDLAVINPIGVVGRVIDVNTHTSQVLLGSDLRSNIDVIVQRSRIKGVAEGNGTDGFLLKYIRQIDDVRLGDIVITSGLSGVFPKGVAVGEVVKIEKGRDNFFKSIEVRPAVNIHQTEEVLVITETGLYAEE